MKKLLIFLIFMPLIVFSQKSEVLEDVEFNPGFFDDSKENRLNLGWAYYGRGNGISLTYDRELSNLFSAGIGFEEYFSEEETEMSYFIITDFHLSELLKSSNSVEIYTGAEFGRFDKSFEAHYYLGISISINKNVGIFTELGLRGIFGVFYEF